jgi:predicted ferric reductase
MTKNFGKILIYLTLIITFILWVLAKADFILEIQNYPLTSLNQIAALLGTVLFSWSFILSTRFSFLESWFGGLDKVYHTHKKVSLWGFGLIVLHPLALAVEHSEHFFRWFLPVHNQISFDLGVYSFWLFSFLVLIALLIKKIKMPYHHWKIIHKLINLAMFLALLHILKINSDVSVYQPLGLWIEGLVGIGLASGIYKSFLYYWIGPRYKYKIIDIKKHNDVFDVFLKPIGKSIKYKPGQFAYVSFLSEKVSKESHPFCIASTPDDDTIRFSIKKLGDFTSTLDALKTGEEALVWGPYGRIGELFLNKKKDAIFIGGGIGIAPFLALFRTASEEDSERRTALFYCTKCKKDACFNSELGDLANANSKLYYHNQCSRDPGQGHLTIEQILKQVRDINNTIVYLCGPSKMMSNLARDLIRAGFAKDNIVLEDFEMI